MKRWTSRCGLGLWMSSWQGSLLDATRSTPGSFKLKFRRVPQGSTLQSPLSFWHWRTFGHAPPSAGKYFLLTNREELATLRC